MLSGEERDDSVHHAVRLAVQSSAPEELSRVLAPSGTLALSWNDLTVWEDDTPDAEHSAAAHASEESLHGPYATRGWAQAQDSAERLYMVGTFYR